MPPTPPSPSEDHESSSPGGADLITPIDLRPAARATTKPGAPPNKSQWLNVLILVAIVLVIVLVGAMLYFFINRNLGDQKVIAPSSPTVQSPQSEPLVAETESPPKVVPAEPSAPAATSPVPEAHGQAAAEEQMAAFVQLKDRLEERAVSQWGLDRYVEMMALSRQADDQMVARDFASAAQSYAAAKAEADRLMGQIDQVLAHQIQAGEAALDEQDAAVAQAKFTLALAIAPDNLTAQEGLQRAATLESVKALMASGKAHEAAGQPDLAYTDYQKALELDSDSAEARDSLARVAAKMKTERFNRLMAAGLNALNRSDYQKARAKLQQARALQPNAPAVADALAQLDQAVRLVEINRLMQPARIAEENEDWPGALANYQKILKLDPNIGFALEGRDRAREQIRFAKRIAFFLEQPHTLTSDTQLQNALALVDEIQGLGHTGPGLSARLQQLKTLIHGYQTPVRVTLESDHLTEVAVYRVGQLGRFAIHELDLRPGTYTVVGSRDGYRDVRQKITLSPGQRPVKVEVACTEKI